MVSNTQKVDAVFEGGGVKGLGLFGAAAVTEEKGYVFENVAGTSAGAIVAALIAAGYKGTELKKIQNEVDYLRFKDPTPQQEIPLIGSVLSLITEKSLYKGDFFESWLHERLQEKNISTFGDLVMEEYKDDPKYRYKLQVIASDISRGKMLVLPRDIVHYGINPDELSVVKAVRMSMSIPFFFKPVTLTSSAGVSSYIVDGALLSNFPIWLFDDGTPDPAWPTLGYKLVDPDMDKPHDIRSPLSLFTAMFYTMMEAHDARYIEDKNFARSIPIPTVGVQTTQFDISLRKRDELYKSGVEAAEEFFKKWNFETYKREYRQAKPQGRQQRLLEE
ncbi:MAG: patatin-like phospholipase family protein [Rhizonema sp. NSF051]|nr:patatin-like phospholipase family protein [Rhizonema sp. NSF051]